MLQINLQQMSSLYHHPNYKEVYRAFSPILRCLLTPYSTELLTTSYEMKTTKNLYDLCTNDVDIKEVLFLLQTYSIQPRMFIH